VRLGTAFTALLALNILALLLSLGVGSGGYEYLFQVISGNADETATKIVLEYRLPRYLMAVIAGASLSASGCAMQALFRNPLAEPYVLGVASGASVGAALSVALYMETIYSRVLFAFFSALLTAYIVYLIGSSSRFRDQTYAILLAGVAIASFFSGLTSILIYFSPKACTKLSSGLWGASPTRSSRRFFSHCQ